MALRNLEIRAPVADKMQISGSDDTSPDNTSSETSSESDMELEGDNRGPELPEREADDNATLIGSVMDCDEATLTGSAADGDEVDHLADLPSADDCKLGLSALSESC